ncbi:ANTAR domain-containing protein [Thioclava sp. GXIMD4216]|uniref:ANTAR domain-containing response regulator n=1 Tax=Thioclava sp. GXIMD4216 TaxID=3131929 RepID=UPI0030CC4C45
MSKARNMPKISDLKGMKVLVFLPPEEEAQELVSHLIRIGCLPQLSWPVPQALPLDVDVVITTVDTDIRAELLALAEHVDDRHPPIIALAGYEDPATLQIVLGLRAAAVIERPVKPFGLLTNLLIARDIRQRRQAHAQRIAEVERRHLSLSVVQLAKILLTRIEGLPPEQTHRHLQKTAMNRRCSLEVLAEEIIARHLGTALAETTPPAAGLRGTRQGGSGPGVSGEGSSEEGSGRDRGIGERPERDGPMQRGGPV